MLYISNQKAAYYYIAQPFSKDFIDLYNFSSMRRTDKAAKTIIDWSIDILKLIEVTPGVSERYELILDFLSNMRTPNINAVIERITQYFLEKGFKPTVSESPLVVKISNLKLEDLINFIQDNDFQSLNNAVESLNCSTWRAIKI